MKNEKGVWITPAFPKLIYVLEENNITEGSKFWYLTKLAARCTAKRMVPDYISEKKMKELKLSKGETPGHGDVYTCMGCRSFLTPDRSGNGWNNVANAGNYDANKPKYYGRFNQGVVTINLVDVALSSGGALDKFWKIFDERLELCYKALMCRHNRLKGTLSDAAPILWQYGALARLKKGEPIDKLLYGGYSTISLGYAGLYECVKYMTGKSHTDPAATPFALEIMQHMNDACKRWKEATDIDFSLYGTPLESTTYKFAKCLQKRFGLVEGITDKNYITNSYHIHVTEHINAFDKLAFESQFQALSPGGAISYVEVPNMQNNLDAVLEVMKFIYDHIMYAELNTKSDYCQVCGFDGEIEIKEDPDGKLVWTCPQCGNTDQSKMNVARRTCGYIGTQYWNQGRTQEIRDRVLAFIKSKYSLVCPRRCGGIGRGCFHAFQNIQNCLLTLTLCQALEYAVSSRNKNFCMEGTALLKIGDFSKLSRISVRMLRHYDEIGLLRPVFVDQFTDYRYYAENQLPIVGRITALKDMGFRLAEISSLLALYDDKEALDAHLAAQQKTLETLAEDTAQRLRLIETARRRLRKDELMNYNVTLRTLPERYCATVRMTIPRYRGRGHGMGRSVPRDGRDGARAGRPLLLRRGIFGQRIQGDERRDHGIQVRKGHVSGHRTRKVPDAPRRHLRGLHLQGRLRADQRRCRRRQRMDRRKRLRLRGRDVRYLPREPARNAEPRRIRH